MDGLKFFLMPSGFIALCFAGGLATLFFRRTKKLGCSLLCTGSLIYLVLSLGPISNALLGHLEYEHPRYRNTGEGEGIDNIVVMAGYAADEAYYPLSSKVNGSTLFRLVEAFDLWLQDRSRQVVITGAGSVPEIMKSVLVRLGVPSSKIAVDKASASSDASALHVRAIVGGRPFLLVTSAGHMPRAMKIFRHVGGHPLPAPTDFMVHKEPFRADVLPSAQHFYFSELAVHEFIAMAWYRLKGTI